MDSTRIRTLDKVRPSTDCPSPRVETFSTSLKNLSSEGADGCGWRDPRSVPLVWRSHLNNEALPGTCDCALLCHADPTRPFGRFDGSVATSLRLALLSTRRDALGLSF